MIRVEKKEKPKERVQQVENRDLQLLKIQIYSDRSHAQLTIGASIALVIFSLISIFYALYYESLMTMNIPFAIVGDFGIVVIAISAILTARHFARRYQKDYQTISDMIEAVKGGQLDEPLCELDKWRKK